MKINRPITILHFNITPGKCYNLKYAAPFLLNKNHIQQLLLVYRFHCLMLLFHKNIVGKV